jgi:hypothetical protein
VEEIYLTENAPKLKEAITASSAYLGNTSASLCFNKPILGKSLEIEEHK